jgi:long-chain acyl-CoA synthetase
MVVGPRDFAADKSDDWALDDDDGRLTWTESNERIDRLMHGVRGLGLEFGDCVGLLGGKRREWLETVGATNGDGRPWVPINWHFSAEEVAHVLENSGAKLLVADAEYGDKALEAAELAEVPLRVACGSSVDGFTAFDDLLASSSADEPAGQTAGQAIVYTSGTTGIRRGSCRTPATSAATSRPPMHH